MGTIVNERDLRDILKPVIPLEGGRDMGDETERQRQIAAHHADGYGWTWVKLNNGQSSGLSAFFAPRLRAADRVGSDRRRSIGPPGNPPPKAAA
jgi:hypothetical protein